MYRIMLKNFNSVNATEFYLFFLELKKMWFRGVLKFLFCMHFKMARALLFAIKLKYFEFHSKISAVYI